MIKEKQYNEAIKEIKGHFDWFCKLEKSVNPLETKDFLKRKCEAAHNLCFCYSQLDEPKLAIEYSTAVIENEGKLAESENDLILSSYLRRGRHYVKNMIYLNFSHCLRKNGSWKKGQTGL